MFIPDSYIQSIIFCLITMICWGSWANTEKLAVDNWRFELFYWDYATGILLASVIFGLTWGTIGGWGRAFTADLGQTSIDSFLSAFAGGVVFNLANILLAAAETIAGSALAFPIAIGIGLVLGVTLNYLGAPLGHPILLFAGVALIGVAVWLDAKAYQRTRPRLLATPLRGVLFAISSGVCLGLFYRLIAAATAHHLAQPEIGKMGPYASVFVFSLGVFLSTFLFVPTLMDRPLSGLPMTADDYLNGSLRDHLIGILGGSIWCVGLELSVLAAERIGYAISFGLAQGAMLVAAIWSIFFWDEFREAPEGTHTLLATMAAAYVLGIVSFILARVYA